MKYQLMHKRTAVFVLDIDKLGMIAKVGALSAPEHLPIGIMSFVQTFCRKRTY